MMIVPVGHRGTILGVPENSIESHEAAYEMGASGIEMDIRATKDNVFVLFHDKSLKALSTGKGKIKTKYLRELHDVYLKDDYADRQIKIPTLREALRNVEGRYMVDIHFKDGPKNSADLIWHVLREEGFHLDTAPLVTIFCESRKHLDLLYSLNSHYRVRPIYDKKMLPGEMAKQGIKVMGLREYQYNMEKAQGIRDNGIKIFANTMKVDFFRVAVNWLADSLGFGTRWESEQPSVEELEKIFSNAQDMLPLFMQADYLTELVDFLEEQGIYESRVMGRDLKPLPGNLQPDRLPRRPKYFFNRSLS